MNHRFKKEESGNPRGRPKGARNFSSIVEDILNEEMRVKINGRQVVATGRHALAMVMVDRAAKGDVRIIQLLQKYGWFERSNESKIKWLLECEARL